MKIHIKVLIILQLFAFDLLAAPEQINLQCRAVSVYGNLDIELDGQETFEFHDKISRNYGRIFEVGTGITHTVNEIGDFQTSFGITGELDIVESKEIQGNLAFRVDMDWYNKDPEFNFVKKVNLNSFVKSNFYDDRKLTHFKERFYLTNEDFAALEGFRSQLPTLNYYRESHVEKAWYDFSKENKSIRELVELPLIGWDIKCVADLVEAEGSL